MLVFGVCVHILGLDFLLGYETSDVFRLHSLRLKPAKGMIGC